MWGRLKEARTFQEASLGIPGPWMEVWKLILGPGSGKITTEIVGVYLVDPRREKATVKFPIKEVELRGSDSPPNDSFWEWVNNGWERKNNKKKDQMEKLAGQRELRKKMLETTVGSALLPLMMLIARKLGINVSRDGDWKGDSAFIHALQQEKLDDRNSLILSGVMETLLTIYSAGTKENPRGEAQLLKDLLDKEIAAKWDATMAKLAAEEESAKLEQARTKAARAEQEAKIRVEESRGRKQSEEPDFKLAHARATTAYWQAEEAKNRLTLIELEEKIRERLSTQSHCQ